MKVLAIMRAERFSPNSVGRDRAIMEAVVDRLRVKDCEVCLVNEDNLVHPGASEILDSPEQLDLILTMGRCPETLDWLRHSNAVVINSPKGIENCVRSRLMPLMESIGSPLPPKEGTDGYWLKRGDAAAQTKGDVVYAVDNEALATAIRTMNARGITDFVVSAHVVGDLVKFYGVDHDDFFRWFYPTDDGQTKFGDESRNGLARHYPFQVDKLRYEVQRLAAAVGVSVYGGDAIVRADGSFCLIDFNDWPSFSRCREAAADAIASLVINRENRSNVNCQN